ncbi:MAG: YqaE/Pmp3 family membrane protein [Chitinophagaceae bacterium]
MKRMFTRMLILVLAFTTIANTAFASLNPVSTEPDPAKVKSAVADFKNLSKKEKNERISKVKTAIKDYKASKSPAAGASTNTLLLVILALLLPPLAVYLHEGAINTKFWISLILTLLFFVPGVIYALIVVLGS